MNLGKMGTPFIFLYFRDNLINKYFLKYKNIKGVPEFTEFTEFTVPGANIDGNGICEPCRIYAKRDMAKSSKEVKSALELELYLKF